MRAAPRLLGVSAGLTVLLAGASAALAQEEDCFPAEAYLNTPSSLPGPFDVAVGAVLLLAPLIPLVMAWTALPSRRYRFARTAAGVALLLASAQGVWALLLLLGRSTGWGVPSLLPNVWELRGLLNDPPEWFLFLGAGSVWAAATWITVLNVDSTREAPPPRVAGARVRVKEPVPVDAVPGGTAGGG